MNKVHFIAIGGSAMHNLALALHKKGLTVTGSDDEILEPSRGRLEKAGLLPKEIGWFPEKLTSDLDAVILGMHARADNPELLRAKEMGLKIFSYPEFFYEQSRDKKRVVIGGSHGKTTITSIILYVLKNLGINTDYLVGAQIEGFDTMVQLSHEAPYLVLEGDEYLSSPIDRRPKFHLYHPHVALISGIAWDHINVFPTFDEYVLQFDKFVECVEPGGVLVYCDRDPEVVKVVNRIKRSDIKLVPYGVPEHIVEVGNTFLIVPTGLGTSKKKLRVQLFGEHNLMNLNGARMICRELGVSDDDFYRAVSSFRGAAKRLELVVQKGQCAFYKDFAHSPSKLKATLKAVKDQFPSRPLVACMELHTFSSLTEEFLLQYKGTMDPADHAMVYFNPHTIEHKKLKPITVEQVKDAFARKDIEVFTDSGSLQNRLREFPWQNRNLLMMSSGNFDGIDFAALGNELIG